MESYLKSSISKDKATKTRELEKLKGQLGISGFDELALDFISKIENYGKKSVIDVNDFLFSKISSKDREQLVNFFDKVIDMYYNIMKIIISNKSDMLYYDKLVKFSYSNDKNKILDKINLIMGAKDAIRYNVNCNLLIDSLILSIGPFTFFSVFTVTFFAGLTSAAFSTTFSSATVLTRL